MFAFLVPQHAQPRGQVSAGESGVMPDQQEERSTEQHLPAAPVLPSPHPSSSTTLLTAYEKEVCQSTTAAAAADQAQPVGPQAAPSLPLASTMAAVEAPVAPEWRSRLDSSRRRSWLHRGLRYGPAPGGIRGPLHFIHQMALPAVLPAVPPAGVWTASLMCATCCLAWRSSPTAPCYSWRCL